MLTASPCTSCLEKVTLFIQITCQQNKTKSCFVFPESSAVWVRLCHCSATSPLSCSGQLCPVISKVVVLVWAALNHLCNPCPQTGLEQSQRLCSFQVWFTAVFQLHSVAKLSPAACDDSHLNFILLALSTHILENLALKNNNNTVL